MSAPDVRTPGGSRASADELGNSSPIVAPASFCGNTDDGQSGLAHRDEECKGLARIKAELARHGYAVFETTDGFLIARWSWSKLAPDLRAVGAFLRQIGVRS